MTDCIGQSTHLKLLNTTHMEDLNVQLNNFASRCFRDVADRDYINARLCYRAGLVPQFHWAALQTFEKYYKAILLFNRIKAKNIKHCINEAQKLAQDLPFEIRLSNASRNLLSHLNDYGRFRYLETSYFINGPKLLELDKAVWEIRRYCRPLNYNIDLPGNNSKSMLEVELMHNERAETRPHQEFYIIGGEIEKILKNKSHPARAPLVWQNGFFGMSKRKRVAIPVRFYVENSPLALHPEILDYVLDYVYLPKEVINAYRAEFKI